MAKTTYRDYSAPSYRYSREIKIYKRANNRYVLTGLASKEEAEKIRRNAVDIVNDYGMVTVADLHDLCGVNGSVYTDNKIGWSAIAGIHWRAVICWDELNGWFIEFPKTNWDYSRHIEVMPAIEQTPTSVSITINTDTIDDFDNIFAKVSQYANTITDRAVYISVI